MDCLQSCLPFLFSSTSHDNIDAKATTIVSILLEAEKPGKELKARLENEVGITSWTEYLAQAVWNKLVEAIQQAKHFGQAMTDALEKSIQAAAGFAREHPVYTALIALGVLVVLFPWAVEALGFGELGPIEGEYFSS